MKTDISAYGPFIVDLLKGKYTSTHDNETRDPMINLLRSLDDIYSQPSSDKSQDRLQAHLTHFSNQLDEVSCFAPYSKGSGGAMSMEFMNYIKDLGLDREFLRERGIDLASFSRHSSHEGVSTVAYASTRSIFNKVAEQFMVAFMKEATSNPQIRHDVKSEQDKDRKLDIIIEAAEREICKKMEESPDISNGPSI